MLTNREYEQLRVAIIYMEYMYNGPNRYVSKDGVLALLKTFKEGGEKDDNSVS